jgi:hypothetical protein
MEAEPVDDLPRGKGSSSPSMMIAAALHSATARLPFTAGARQVTPLRLLVAVQRGMGALHGISRLFLRHRRPPPCGNVAYDGLATVVEGDALDIDRLLAFAAITLHRFSLCRVCAGPAGFLNLSSAIARASSKPLWQVMWAGQTLYSARARM